MGQKEVMFDKDLILLSVLKKANFKITFKNLSKPFIKIIQNLLAQYDVEVAIFDSYENPHFIPIIATDVTIVEQGEFYEIEKRFISDEVLLKLSTSFNPFYSSVLIIPMRDDNNEIFSAVGIYCKNIELKKEDIEQLTGIMEHVSPLFYQGYKYERANIEEKRRELLLQVTKKFHSSMDVGEVLEEIIYALNVMYPTFAVKLLLAREWQVENDDLPIMQINYGASVEHGSAENVLLTGEIRIEDIVSERCSVLFAPLRGKQGIYGVMEIKTPTSVIFPKHEIDFIEMLADIGGNALENAELYQQSRSLINDLQLINKTSHKLNSNLKLSETVAFMTEQISHSFGASEVGYLLFTNSSEITVLEGSTEFFSKPQSIKPMREISNKIRREKEPIYIGDVQAEQRYSLTMYRSLLVVPMIQSDQLKGMVVVLHENPYHFTFDNFKLLQSLVHHSTLAFTNSMLHEELEKLVITDYLTRLYSRNYLDQKIQESMETDAYGCFILIDIDDFKKINDTYGHQVGDDIIIQVANIIKKNIRSSRENSDIAARWGGEELAIYLPRVNLETGEVIANRIVRAVELETSPRVTISCGVSCWDHTDDEKSLTKLFNLADESLYVAKQSGKNQVVINHG